MPRAAPRDYDFAPSQAKSFTNPSNQDLTNQFPAVDPAPGFGVSNSNEYPYPPCTLMFTVPTAGTVTVRMQAAATNVVLSFTVGTFILRASVAFIVSCSQADTSVTAFWQGGPS